MFFFVKWYLSITMTCNESYLYSTNCIQFRHFLFDNFGISVILHTIRIKNMKLIRQSSLKIALNVLPQILRWINASMKFSFQLIENVCMRFEPIVEITCFAGGWTESLLCSYLSLMNKQQASLSLPFEKIHSIVYDYVTYFIWFTKWTTTILNECST